MIKHRQKLTLLLTIVSLLMFIVTGCGNENDSVEAFAPDPSESITSTETSDGTPLETETAPIRRDYRTSLKGNGEDVVTLMVYLCGSDLESRGAAASVDLAEIVMAEGCENLNIVVETGGANEWAFDFIDPGLNQRWQVRDNDLFLLESAEAKNMSKGDTLRDFISYSAEKFPADRYMLVLWDHGGGTVDGYAYDERFKDNAMMSLAELDEALNNAGITFDMIGFDCCLMGTAETAFMTEKYADYMIASQRVEPGNGWHYTPWITALAQNTSIPTDEMGAVIVDSYIEASKDGYYGHELTLSVTDLTGISDLFNSMYAFFGEAQDTMIDDGMFISTSRVLSGSRAMQDKYDLVDMAFLIESMEDSEELCSKLNQCVVYNGATIKDYNGLCLYFPYTDLDKVADALNIYEQIGIGKPYQDFIAAYANVMLGGQAYNDGGSGNSMSDGEFDLNFWLGAAWADEEAWDSLAGFYEDNSFDPSVLLPIEEIEHDEYDYALTLTDDEWDLFNAIEMLVYLDDGEGYIILGYDSKYDFDGHSLYITFDGSWVALNGQNVCYYSCEADYSSEDDYFWYDWGIVPILYDGREAELVLRWDRDNPDGFVAGWRYTNVGSGSQKGLFELQDGMYFDFLCDYHTYDDVFEDEYLLGGMTVDGPITVSYEDVGDYECMVYYVLYDAFQNPYYTEPLIFGY